MSTTTPINETASSDDLFTLTDEQILEIAPNDAAAATYSDVDHEKEFQEQSGQRTNATLEPDKEQAIETTQHADSHEPPLWLADRMADPQNGTEARDFWNGIQQARQEAAAFREVFAKPEEARAVAERARALDEIDRAFFGVAGNSAEQSSAARADLAARMMQQDPAAFREMVFAGLRALESTQSPTNGRHSTDNSTPAASTANTQTNSQQDARVSAYAAFEKAANEDLARSVGGAIARTLEQALPNASVGSGSSTERAQRGGALKERLSNAIRQDVEKTLQADRQLGEQVAQILSGGPLDETTRAQVVRLIGERAQHLVPGSAKRVLQDWTQTTLASHHARNERGDAPARTGVPTAPATRPAETSQARLKPQHTAPGKARVADYSRLSDEQILDL